MPTVTRESLSQYLFDVLGIPKCTARKVVDCFIEEVCENLEQGREVKLFGFGNFILHDKPARVGRNPQTGQECEISPRRVVTFRAGKKLRQRVENHVKETTDKQ